MAINIYREVVVLKHSEGQNKVKKTTIGCLIFFKNKKGVFMKYVSVILGKIISSNVFL